MFLQELAAKDAELLSQEEQEKPVPPEKINEDEARDKIKQKALEMRRKPGTCFVRAQNVSLHSSNLIMHKIIKLY